MFEMQCGMMNLGYYQMMFSMQTIPETYENFELLKKASELFQQQSELLQKNCLRLKEIDRIVGDDQAIVSDYFHFCPEILIQIFCLASRLGHKFGQMKNMLSHFVKTVAEMTNIQD